MRIFIFRGVATTALLGVLWPLLAGTQEEPWRLAAVEFNGLRINRPEVALEASGLEIGQTVSRQDLNAAAQRLVDSGLFSTIRYRYVYRGRDLTVTFTVEELDVRVPVIFDNFVCCGDDEILGAVRSQLPRFNGAALPSGDDNAGIREGLRLLLHEKDVRGYVDIEEIQDAATKAVRALIVRLQGVDYPICGLRFPGAGSVPEKELLKASQSLIGSDYSRAQVEKTVRAKVLPLYHRAGRLRAEFQTPVAQPLDHPQCPGGVLVTIPVAEGYAYAWDKAEWTGATLFSDEELDRLIGLERGQVADADRIEAGLDRIREAYRSKGKTNAKIDASPLFEDDVLRVIYRVSIEEEPDS